MDGAGHRGGRRGPRARLRDRSRDRQHRGVHRDVRRPRDRVEHHGRLHRLRLAGTRCLLRVRRLRVRPRARAPRHPGWVRALCVRPGCRCAHRGACTGDRLDRAAHPRRDVRDRDHRDDVHDPAACREPRRAHRRWFRAELPGAALERRLLRHAVLLRDAGDGPGLARDLVVDPALEVRPRAARDPRRRGQGARRRRSGARLQADRVHHQRRSGGDDRRRLRLLRHLHLPAVSPSTRWSAYRWS